MTLRQESFVASPDYASASRGADVTLLQLVAKITGCSRSDCVKV